MFLCMLIIALKTKLYILQMDFKDFKMGLIKINVAAD